jgi:hypothetical protein
VVALGCLAIPFSERLIASDRDVDPYMIYIDPETGKYTTQKPGHDKPGNDSISPIDTQKETSTAPAVTPLTPALFISGGLILLSHLLAFTLKRRA